MTANQLKYWAQKEEARANLARESETYRHDYEMEQETKRSNLEREALGLQQLAESKRSNLARELETNRSNLASESIRRDSNALSYSSLGETITHNRASESNNLLLANLQGMALSEQARSNLANEAIRRTSNTNVSLNNATRMREAAEQERSNRVRELQNEQQMALTKRGQRSQA